QLTLREAWTWSHLNHPNVVPFLGVADYKVICPGALPQLSLVSRWMAHGNIMEYTREHPSADRLPLLTDIAKGVNYLHTVPSPPIIHGDLKGVCFDKILLGPQQSNDWSRTIFWLICVKGNQLRVLLTSDWHAWSSP
ncbi:hypothetical protein CALCODRAFT_437311, partial [Calocera cornea HHB12733]